MAQIAEFLRGFQGQANGRSRRRSRTGCDCIEYGDTDALQTLSSELAAAHPEPRTRKPERGVYRKERQADAAQLVKYKTTLHDRSSWLPKK